MADLWRRRLDTTGRACDHCGNRIGRWTKKCHYDEQADRCYCSPCSGVFAEVPSCGKCGCPVNPYLDGAMTATVRGVEFSFCPACSLEESTEDREDLLPPGYMHAEAPNGRALTAKQRAAVKAGPYLVIERADGYTHFQVVRRLPGGRLEIRSSLSERVRAFEKCSDFNEEVA